MAGKGEGPAIGIDLGTTYSFVGVWQHDRVEIIANNSGNRTTPSYAFFTDTKLRLIGAKNPVVVNPVNTVFETEIRFHEGSESPIKKCIPGTDVIHLDGWV